MPARILPGKLTYCAYIPSRPTEDAYQTWIEVFFSDTPYVAKCLQQGQHQDDAGDQPIGVHGHLFIPQWFVEKWGDKVHFGRNRRAIEPYAVLPVSSQFEAKTYTAPQPCDGLRETTRAA